MFGTTKSREDRRRLESGTVKVTGEVTVDDAAARIITDGVESTSTTSNRVDGVGPLTFRANYGRSDPIR